MEHEDLAPGEQSAVDFKGGIFRGSPDKQNTSLFYKGKECVLLRFVKPVNFIYKYNGAGSESSIALRLLHNGANLLNPAGNSGECNELCFGGMGNHLG